VILAGLLARAAIFIWAEKNPSRFDYPDGRRYMQVARNLAEGMGPVDSSSVRAGTDPLYPIVLAPAARAGGGDRAMARWGRVVNLLAGCAAIFLTAQVGGLLFGESVGLFAAAIFAMEPIQIFFCGLVLTESLYTFFLLGAVYCLVRMKMELGWRWAAACGVILGLATLTRSSHLFLNLLLIPMLAAWTSGDWRRRASSVAVATLAMIVTLSPNVVRNYKLFDKLILTRSGSGASMMEGLGPWADGAPGMDRIRYPEFAKSADEFERDAACRNEALEWARDNPARAMSLAWTKLRRTWSPTINAPGYDRPLYAAVGWLTTMPVFVLIVIGAWRVRRDWRVWSLLVAPAAYYTLVHMVFVGSVRYRIPAMPMLFVLAGAAAVTLYERSRARTARQGG
jgi:4-amino-4-deoxy-L-arabinose transferase-like glycosyltransferase